MRFKIDFFLSLSEPTDIDKCCDKVTTYDKPLFTLCDNAMTVNKYLGKPSRQILTDAIIIYNSWTRFLHKFVLWKGWLIKLSFHSTLIDTHKNSE